MENGRFRCEICGTNKDEDKIVMCTGSGRHLVCVRCAQLASGDDARILCPDGVCTGQLVVFRGVDDARMQEQVYLRRLYRGLGAGWVCPFCTELRPCELPEWQREFTCEVSRCKKTSCRLCLEAAHQGCVCREGWLDRNGTFYRKHWEEAGHLVEASDGGRRS